MAIRPIPEPSSQLLSDADYLDLVEKLNGVHPEDLVNIISRVLLDRKDLSFKESHGDETSSRQTSQITVPASPQDYTDPGKFFTISIQCTVL